MPVMADTAGSRKVLLGAGAWHFQRRTLGHDRGGSVAAPRFIATQAKSGPLGRQADYEKGELQRSPLPLMCRFNPLAYASIPALGPAIRLRAQM